MVHGDDQMTIDIVNKVAEAHGSKIAIPAGKATAIGTDSEEGDDRQQRDAAGAAYRAIIQEAQDTGGLRGHDWAGLWKDIHDRWPTLQTEFLAPKETGGWQPIAETEVAKFKEKHPRVQARTVELNKDLDTALQGSKSPWLKNRNPRG